LSKRREQFLASLIYRPPEGVNEMLSQRAIGMIQGVGIAIQYLINAHGEDSIAGYLFRETGYSLEEFEKYCDEYDLQYIRKAAE